MKQKTRAPLFACLLVVCSTVPAFAIKGWRLQQTSDFYGDQVAYISPEVIVIETKKLGIKLFMTAPDYHITGINYGSKSYARLSQAECKSELLLSNHAQSFVHKKFGKDTVAGVATDKYVLENKERPSVKKSVPASTIGGKTYNTVFWVAPQIKVPMKLADMMMSMMQLPHGLGLPMRMMQYSGKGTEIITLDTRKVEKVTFPADLLTIPKGYTKVKDEMTLMFSDDQNSDLDGILRTARKGVKKPGSEPWVPPSGGEPVSIPGGPLHSNASKSKPSWH